MNDVRLQEQHDLYFPQSRGDASPPYVVRTDGAWLVGSRHTKNSEAGVVRGIRKERAAYTRGMPREQQLFMIEGFDGGEIGPHELDALLIGIGNEQEAVGKFGEAGTLLWVAREKNIKIVSPEFPEAQVMAQLRQEGFSAEDSALFYVLRQLTTDISLPPQPAPSPEENLLYFAKFFVRVQELTGVEWFNAGLKQTLEIVIKQHDVAAAQKLVPEIIRTAIAGLNDAFARVTAQQDRMLFPSADALAHRRDGGDQGIPTDLVSAYFDPVKGGHSVTNAISARVCTLRDEYLLHEIFAAQQAGRTPFVLYGASHVFALEDAVKALGH